MTVTIRRTKLATGNIELMTDLTPRIIPLRVPGVSYAVDDFAQPATPTGRLYVCVEAGVSGTIEPRWHHDGRVTDGTVVWEPRDLGDAALPAVSAAVWTASSSGLTLSGQVQNGYRSRILASGGAAGSVYSVDLSVAFDTGTTVTARFKVEVVSP